MSRNENQPINLGLNLRHKYSQKPYFGTMFFKIVYDIRDPKEHKRPANVWNLTPTTRRDWFSKAKILSSAISRFCVRELKANYRQRTESNRVTFFLEKEEHARALVKQFDKNIVEVYVPYNNMQIQIGSSDMMATPLFRSKLFEQSNYCNGFRYKVQVNATNEIKAMKSNLNSFFANISRQDYSLSYNAQLMLDSDPKRGERLARWNKLSMYFNDEQDLLMLKLMMGLTEMEVYKVILHKELIFQDK